ncbi:glycoside hydrolase family 88 protein [Breznakiella homolactica]|uniref:Glycoside hydrolase family 88 protein n=1 Tax=Breznakiella homolactica TaxID=2798577 RepID=A0A7T8BC73_9SPIR|nr:glycoside hydrolase family 88 protein [Breznakiella homolactica]QQO10850.1 glycoside hydrolase family 88 protein [Breznakiella homolactica]
MKTDLFPGIAEASGGDIAAALDACAGRVYANLPEFTYRFQPPASRNNFYYPIENTEWTTGFWTGEIWLAWEHSRREVLKYAALIQTEDFRDRIVRGIKVDHHDMGFLYSLSCVAAWKLTGNERAKETAVMAADKLVSRFHEKGRFIQAWGPLGARDNYRLIIDCLLNLPLLHWASEVTGNARYREVALAHAETCLRVILRPDNSAYHTFFFNPETGEPDHGATHQGYKDDSPWARGQAWGIYGTALSYRYTKNPEYLEVFRKMTEFYFDRLPADMVPYWDLYFTEGEEPRDSSAAAITACGLLEMAEYLEDEEAGLYRKLARQTVGSLIAGYAVRNDTESNGLLLHGTYAKNSPYNTCENNGVDECVSWGDYFFMEALTRLSKDWTPYW